MTSEQIVELAKQALRMALTLGAPLLLIATLVSLIINIGQVLTSLQETTIATVPKLAAVAITAVLLMPWMVKRLAFYTVQLFSDFSQFTR